MVNKAIPIAITAVIANTSQLIFVLYAKSCNHLFITNQVIGEAIQYCDKYKL